MSRKDRITVEVKSLPLKDVIHDIAQAFGGVVISMCSEYKVLVPEEVGEGEIRATSFTSGMGLIIYDCRFKCDMEFRFTVSDIHPVKFLYCMKGTLNHNFAEEMDEAHEVAQFKSAIVASESTNGHVLHFDANRHHVVCSLEVSRREFSADLHCELNMVDQKLSDLFMDRDATKKFYYNGYYSLALAEIFKELETMEYNGILKRLFYESKAYELLTLQIDQFNDAQRAEEEQTLLLRTDINAVQRALDYIRANLSEEFTIQDLVRVAGTNKSKLQNGFKIIKGQTINEYIQSYRLDTARHLLASTDLSVSEIVYEIGLSNRSYFAKQFKEEFGMTPSEYRENLKS